MLKLDSDDEILNVPESDDQTDRSIDLETRKENYLQPISTYVLLLKTLKLIIIIIIS